MTQLESEYASLSSHFYSPDISIKLHKAGTRSTSIPSNVTATVVPVTISSPLP